MCPLETCQGSVGNCHFCGQKDSCILVSILSKLEKMESIINGKNSVGASL
jgi:hypothetical protein